MGVLVALYDEQVHLVTDHVVVFEQNLIITRLKTLAGLTPKSNRPKSRHREVQLISYERAQNSASEWLLSALCWR